MNDLHYAVCVGIDRYPGLPGRDLGSARRDAESFRDWLVDPDGGALPADNVRLVTVPPNEVFASPADARPQQREVNRALKEFNDRLRQHLPVHPEDWPRTRLYMYAAGHGIGPPNGEGALLMADAERDMLGYSIELSLYADWYLHCGLVREVVIFADCCREIGGGIPPASAPPFNICAYPSFKGTTRFLGYASRFGDLAWEPADPSERDRARGYFTQALLDGLRRPGEVTAMSLAQYVQQTVEKLTAGVAPYPQRGEMLVDAGTPIVFRAGAPDDRSSAAPHHRATIRFPPGFGDDVVVRTGDRRILARWRASDGPWTISLPDGFYQVATESGGGSGFQANGLFALTGVDADVQL